MLDGVTSTTPLVASVTNQKKRELRFGVRIGGSGTVLLDDFVASRKE